MSIITRPLIFKNHFLSTGANMPPTSFSTTISTGAVTPELAVQQLLELRKQEANRLQRVAATDDILRNKLLQRQQHLSNIAKAIEQTQRFSRYDDVFRSSTQRMRTEPLLKSAPSISTRLTPEQEKEVLKKNEAERRKFGAEIYKDTYGEEPTKNILDMMFPKTASPLGDGDSEKLKQVGDAIKQAVKASPTESMFSSLFGITNSTSRGVRTNPMLSQMLGSMLKQEAAQTQTIFNAANQGKQHVIPVGQRLVPIRKKRTYRKVRR